MDPLNGAARVLLKGLLNMDSQHRPYSTINIVVQPIVDGRIKDEIIWMLTYTELVRLNDSVFQTRQSAVTAHYFLSENVFKYDDDLRMTTDPKEVLRFFESRLGLVRNERLEILARDARSCTRHGTTLSDALNNIRQLVSVAEIEHYNRSYGKFF